jgi:hypothetical protein
MTAELSSGMSSGECEAKLRFAQRSRACQYFFSGRSRAKFQKLFLENLGNLSKIILEHLTPASNSFPAKKSSRRNAF